MRFIFFNDYGFSNAQIKQVIDIVKYFKVVDYFCCGWCWSVVVCFVMLADASGVISVLCAASLEGAGRVANISGITAIFATVKLVHDPRLVAIIFGWSC